MIADLLTVKVRFKKTGGAYGKISGREFFGDVERFLYNGGRNFVATTQFTPRSFV